MPILNDHITYKIAAHFLSPIFNGDDSGLDSKEIRQLDAFMCSAMCLPDATWEIPEDDSPEFAICEVTGLYADCYEVNLFFTNEE